MAVNLDEAELLAALKRMVTPEAIETLSMKKVMKQLRGVFGDGVKERKAWVSEQVTAIVQTLPEAGAPTAAAPPAEEAGAPTAAAPPAQEAEAPAAPAAAVAEEEEAGDGAAAAAEAPAEEPKALTDEQMAAQMQAEFDAESRRGRRRCAAPPKPEPKRRAPKRQHTEDGAEGRPKKKQGWARPMLVLDPLLSYLRQTGAMGPAEEQMGRSDINKHLIGIMKAPSEGKPDGMKDPKDGRQFLLDEALQAVFKRKTLTYFSIAKHLTPMLKRPEDVSSDAPAPKKPKKAPAAKGKGKAKAKAKGKAKGKVQSGMYAPLRLAPELSAVCGGATQLTRGEIMKALWAYFKANELQNPDNKKMILCDENLLKITKGEREVAGFAFSKHIGPFLSKIDRAELQAAAAAAPSSSEEEEDDQLSSDSDSSDDDVDIDSD